MNLGLKGKGSESMAKRVASVDSEHQLYESSHLTINKDTYEPPGKQVRLSKDSDSSLKSISSKDSYVETNAEFDQNSVYTTNIGAEEGTLVEMPESTAEDIVTAINGIQEENKEIFARWKEEFSAAEDFEMLCPSRLDELLKEAYALENSLIEQKEKLKHRLQLLSKTLDPLRIQTT